MNKKSKSFVTTSILASLNDVGDSGYTLDYFSVD